MRTCIKCGRESIMAICEMCSIDGKFDKESSSVSNKNLYSSFLNFMMDKYNIVKSIKNAYNDKSIKLYGKNTGKNYSGLSAIGYAPAYAKTTYAGSSKTGYSKK